MDLVKSHFLEFVRPHLRLLHVVACQYVRGEPDAQDLVQETLLRAWRGFRPDEERTYQRSWLLVILRNVALEWARAAGSRVRLTLLPDLELTDAHAVDPGESLPPLPPADAQGFREQLDGVLARALDELEGPFREVIVLSVAGGLGYREISEVLDCPLGTVMSRMARARRALRERLSREYVAPPSRRVRPS